MDKHMLCTLPFQREEATDRKETIDLYSSSNWPEGNIMRRA